ncbi:TonB-dependent siderophore receptor [Phyllobacterium myrsinacearum]|uniref:Iron complex outermembrane receptor protein n=1 Tax=Phyllobacterium myrsinacearum TaxID=28101 RepID=A0A839EXQ2_9HYPH|nr:iron complex outermembrane receptor protein [Phyllobacterium myrsinacearum]
MNKRIGVLSALVAGACTPAVAQDVIELKPITIRASEWSSSLPEEYSGGQVAKGSRVGMLGNRDVMDTPFSTTTYTAKSIENTGASTVADVVARDPSVRNTHATGGMVDSFYIRGFPVNEGNFGEIAFDGVYGVAPTYRVSTDYAERIEVLKGPSALIYGISPNSSVGGVINLVPKRAPEVDLTRLTTDYVSNLQGGAHLDIARRFGEEREFGMRFNGSLHGGDTPIDDQTREMYVGALALDYKGESFRATVDLIGQKQDFTAPQRPFFPVAGITIPEAPNGRLNIEEPWEWSKNRDLSWLARAEYDLNDTITVFGAVGGGNSHVTRLFGTPTLLNSNGDVSVVPQNFVFDVDRMTAETGARAQFDTGLVTHAVTFQATYLRQTLDRGSASGTAQLTNIYHPVLRPEQNVRAPGNVGRASESTLSGLALSDTLSILDERVQLTVGGRLQSIDSNNFNATTGATTSSSNETSVTPLVGLVVKPWENVSLYANYIEGLGVGDTAPATAVNAGETLAPYQSKQYEIGAKIDLDRVILTMAVFQIEKPYGQLESQGAGLIFVDGGEQRNRGLEVNIAGEVSSNLRLLGGVAFIDGELTKTDNTTTVGNTPIGVPSIQTNLGAEWDTPFMKGLTLAANVIYTDEQFADTANTQRLPSWVRLDLGARYSTKIEDRPVTFRASIENVFNKDYWSGVASFGTISQGAPLTVKLSMTTGF